MKVKDIEGNELKIGDEVFYARKNPYSAKGLLVKTTIKNITSNGFVSMEGGLLSTTPEDQIVMTFNTRAKIEEFLKVD